MQKVIMVGNLTKDPEKVTGQDLCKINIAVRNDYRGQDGEYGCEYFSLALWNKLSEIAMKYLKKGSKVLIVGRLQNRTWESDGVKRYATEIVVKEMEMLSSPRKEESQLTPIDDDSMPF